ncbi:recombinase family protein [Nonomuraea angiospora]|uniref:recombinase family protein n=1 Tax=Nonomuraea angiospora TaxID=46172 RepID=UPI003428A29F
MSAFSAAASCSGSRTRLCSSLTVWAYARVSTRDQNPQLQLDALATSGYDELVMEKESGKRTASVGGTSAMLPGKKKTGRPRVIGPAELATLRRLVDEGVSITEAARTLKIGRSTAYTALAGR